MSEFLTKLKDCADKKAIVSEAKNLLLTIKHKCSPDKEPQDSVDLSLADVSAKIEEKLAQDTQNAKLLE